MIKLLEYIKISNSEIALFFNFNYQVPESILIKHTHDMEIYKRWIDGGLEYVFRHKFEDGKVHKVFVDCITHKINFYMR